jgi:hypothetical protein
MTLFLGGVIVGGALAVIFVGHTFSNIMAKCKDDSADWWKNGDPNPDYVEDDDDYEH